MSIPFPAAGTETLRAINDANLPQTCTATVPTPGVDDGEGGTLPGVPVTFSFPCRTWPLNSREMETLVADQLRQPGLEGIVMPVGQVLPLTATVTVTRGLAATAYEVVGMVPDPTYAMMSRAIIKRRPEEEAA